MFLEHVKSYFLMNSVTSVRGGRINRLKNGSRFDFIKVLEIFNNIEMFSEVGNIYTDLSTDWKANET